MKYVVLLLVFVLFYAYWRSQNPRKNLPKDPPKNPQAGKAARPPRPPLELPQPMVACQHCGLHLPISEALSSGQRYYCCAEHQRIDAR